MSTTDRKSSYKLPPPALRDRASAQELRRIKALEEQKRRRAQKIDASRQLDFFADLSIAEDDEDAEEVEYDKEERAQKSLAVASVAGYAALLQTSALEDNQPLPSTSDLPALGEISEAADISLDASAQQTASKPRNRKSKKSSHKRRAGNRGSSKYADKCMYAELLEMSGDVSWDAGEGEDGLPTDLETAWVAVGPVPVGKRCLAVTHNQGSGATGAVANTQLRSRLLGKSLISPFPSNLPPLTVLDCILDDRWRENGILHVLDVVTWKGQDVSACEAAFRFWWRDTRLGELPTAPPASFRFVAPSKSRKATSNPSDVVSLQFPYPTTFLPVPYYTRTALADLDSEIIPAAKRVREVEVVAPATIGPSNHNDQLSPPPVSPTVPFTFGSSIPSGPSFINGAGTGDSGMDIEPLNVSMSPVGSAFHFAPPSSTSPIRPSQHVAVQPDGLLLYVAEAAYEPGTSPLSSWVPIRSYDNLDNHEANGGEDAHGRGAGAPPASRVPAEGPLDLFQRLVRRRILKRTVGSGDHLTQHAGLDANRDVDMMEM